MKTKISIILCAIILMGCEDGYRQISFPVLPDDLKDCKIYDISSVSGRNITIVRCPNSDTTTKYKSGKSTYITTVIDL